MYKIYKLTDPITDKIKYVGLTESSIYQRLVGHLADAYNRPRVFSEKGLWLKALVESGYFPKVELLEITEDKSREVYWIQLLQPDLNLVFTGNKEFWEHRSNVHSKAIFQYDLSGSFVLKWKSALMAAKTLGIDATNIASCISGNRKQAGNFLWSDSKLERLPVYKRKGTGKEVHMYSLNGEYLRSFNSARETSSEGFSYKYVSKCCLGINQTHAGHKFSFTKIQDIVQSS